MPTRRATRRCLAPVLTVLGLLPAGLPPTLAAEPAPVAAQSDEGENPACEEAIRAYDAAYSGRSDIEAMEAAEALVRTCGSPDALEGRAESRVAMIHYQRKDLRAAVASFEKSVRLAPANVTLRQSLCGAYTEAGRLQEAIDTCVVGLALAKQQDDGTAEKHDRVLRIGRNLALAKMRRGGDLCLDESVREMLEAYRTAHPEDAWVHQAVGAWVWDCEGDFATGFALYKQSCALGQESACEQVRYTESCHCQERQDGP